MDLHKDYYRKFDTMCFKLAKDITDFGVKDSAFLTEVQDARNKQMYCGADKHGTIKKYMTAYSINVCARKCKQKCFDYTRTNEVIYLYDALNYLMIEYLVESTRLKPVDEVDVLDMFYSSVWEESDSLMQVVYSFLHVYENFHETGYLLLAALAIYDELYKCKLMGRCEVTEDVAN